MLLDMSSWPERRADVIDGLRLDPANVRLNQPESTPEADILQDLFQNEDALTLVSDIVQVGFYSHERPVVVTRQDDLVVVEGNRRIAALKAIQNPNLAPAFRRRISELINELEPEERNRLRTVTVIEAPSQEQANQLIASLHAANRRKPWKPARQAAFFQAQLDAGASEQTLVEQYPTIDVRKFVVRSKLLNSFAQASTLSPTESGYLSSSSFSVSTLERLCEATAFSELIGVTIDRPAMTVRIKDQNRFDRLARVVINDIKEHRIDTRKLNSVHSATYQAYLDKLNTALASEDHWQRSALSEDARLNTSEEPDKVSTSGQEPESQSSTAKSQTASGSPANGQPNEIPSTGAPTLYKNGYLITKGLTVPSTYPGPIADIHQEITTLKYTRFPNATSDLLRTFLEKSIKAYADDRGQEQELQRFGSGNGYVQLDGCLKWLLEYVKRDKRTSYQQPIERLRDKSNRHFMGSTKPMNASNHNHRYRVESRDVEEMWGAMYEVLRLTLPQ